MAQNKGTKGTALVITRKAKGRKAGPTPKTVERFTLLDSLYGAKGNRIAVTVNDDAGKVVDTFDALPIMPTDVKAESTYTGLPGLIGAWAKDRGHSVKVIAHPVEANGVLVQTKG